MTDEKELLLLSSKPTQMSRKYFRNISILAIVSLLSLAVVQSVWVFSMYNDSVDDFRRRVESSIYKSIYKAFRMDAIPDLQTPSMSGSISTISASISNQT